jgi:branched-chain amino acid transport system ATP-binding protein
MLALESVHVAYGSCETLHGVSLEVREGEIVTLIGSNGAGKTTTLKTISGLLAPKSGAVRWRGEDVTGHPPHALVRRGLAHVPEGRRIFAALTVRENLEMGGFTVGERRTLATAIDRAFALFPRLRERVGQPAGTLSGGEQQMLAIARALVARPRLLLLDEPSLGLAPLLVQEIFREIGRINREDGVTILLVEQNAHLALGLASRGYVIETGRIVLEDLAPALLANPQVREAYLG